MYKKVYQAVGGIPFVATTPTDAARMICESASSGVTAHVHLLNAYSLALAAREADYRTVLSDNDWNFPDGKPVSWVSRFRLDRPALKQVRGPDLFMRTLGEGRAYELRHYLLGSTPDVLEKLQTAITERFPGVQIVGSFSPPFRPMTEADFSSQDSGIRACEPHIVWVGLGTPKQDFEVARLSRSTGIISIAVGAAFDFGAGTTKEAPRVFGTLGLEWVYRLITEPRRLWRRYLFGNPVFVMSALRHWRRKPSIANDPNPDTP